jgi:hypothetical protein
VQTPVYRAGKKTCKQTIKTKRDDQNKRGMKAEADERRGKGMLLGHLCQPAGQRPARSEREED